MPVQFYCPHCRQLLKVGRRKIGTLVACPRCGSPTVVPDAGSGAMPLAEQSIAGFDDVNELLRQGAAPPQPPAAAGAIGWSPAGFQPTAAPRAVAVDSGALDLLVVSRSAVYVQAVLFLAVACIAFAAGYWLGHSRPAPGEAKAVPVTAKPEPVLLAGTITYNVSMGRAEPDAGAVVLALPITPPRQKIKAAGLCPEDPSGAARDTAAGKLEAAGGGYARAGDNGSYDLVVPVPGEYHVLAISQHVPRPSDERLPEADLKLLAPYFEVVTDLIGSRQYKLIRKQLSGRPTWSYTFQ